MIRRILNISALALGLVLAGCSAIREDVQPGGGLEIKFTAQVGTFQVKATDTGLELGDQVGLFASEPVSASNVKMTWDGTALVPETRLFWTPGDERTVNFTAYYPYDPEKNDGWSEFFVNADQSTHALFTASDFMSAYSASRSSDGVVSFNFQHRFSKIIIHLDNQLQEQQITDVYLSNVYGRVQGDVSGSYGTIGYPGTIKTCQATTLEGEPVWAVIIPAQSCQPQLMITTADGKQFTYESSYYLRFEQSCRYNAYVTLTENDIFTDFTSEVTEWTDNNDLAFPVPGRENWSVYGNFQGTEWDVLFPMRNCYEGIDAYYAMVYAQAGEELKLIKDGNVNYGLKEGVELNDMYDRTLVKDGIITFKETDVYELFWYPHDRGRLEVYPAGVIDTWGITGTLEGLGWERDHMVDYTFLELVENDAFRPKPAFNIKYREGEEFKIRFGGAWYLEYGYDSDTWESQVIETRTSVPLKKGGPNLMLPEDGFYSIYFDPYEQSVYAYKTGDLPSRVSIDEVLNGTDGETYWTGGYITNIKNTRYGNYFIAESPYADVNLYIYGTVNSKGYYPRNAGGWYTDEFGMLPGDYVEVEGVRSTYNGTVELVDVKLVNVERQNPLGFLNGDYASMDAAGGDVQFYFRCFGKPEVRTDAYWLSYYWDYMGSDWYTLYVNVPQNTGEARQGVVNFYYDGTSASVVIDQEKGEKQAGQSLLYASQRTIHALYDQDYAALEITANAEWTAQKTNPEDDWFRLLNTRFSAGYSYLEVYLSRNETGKMRTGTITLTARDNNGGVDVKQVTIKQASEVTKERWVLDNDQLTLWTSDWDNWPVYNEGQGTFFQARARLHKEIPMGSYTFRWKDIQGSARIRHWFCFPDSYELRVDLRPLDGRIAFNFNIYDGDKPSLDSYFDVDWTQPVELTYRFQPSETNPGYCLVSYLYNGIVMASYETSADMLPAVRTDASPITLYFGVQEDDPENPGSAVLEWIEYEPLYDWGDENDGISDLDVINDFSW